MFEKVCSFAHMPNAYKTILVVDLRTTGYYLNNAVGYSCLFKCFKITAYWQHVHSINRKK